jgi:glycerophosphoryl diester phosphodiesterase
MLTNIAHRGARSLAPENTLLAAQRAWEIGADLWETDVAVTADHQLILMHDVNFLRTTNVAQCFPGREKQPVGKFTLEQIRLLDAGTWFLGKDPFGQIKAGQLTFSEQEACRKQAVPTLEDALILTKSLSWRINLELKPLYGQPTSFAMVTEVLKLIDRIQMGPDQVIISSFYHPYLREIKSLRPGLPIQALIGDTAFIPMDWGSFEFEIYNANHSLIDKAQIETAHKRGVKLNIFTVNEISDMQIYQNLGIAGLFTDFPQRLKTLQ